MKFFYLICLLSITNLLKAQDYKFPVGDLKQTDKAEFTNNKVNLANADEVKKIKVRITGTDADLDKVKLTAFGDPANPIAGTKVDGGLEFILKDAFSKTPPITAFDVYFGDEIKGVVSFTTSNSTTGTPPPPPDKDKGPFDTYIGAMASANFVGNNKFLSNLTPVVNLGNIINLTADDKPVIWQLDVNPYLGAEIDTKDSVSFIPALMLYGRAGFVINNYLKFTLGKKKKVGISVMPLGFGLKFIPNLQDSGRTLIQHTLRTGIAFSYSDDLLIGAQLTQGWHNLTSESKKTYEKVFTNKATDISYITVLAQMALHAESEKGTNYIFFEWRSLLSKKHYADFTNIAILTFGIRKTFEMSAIFRQTSSGGSGGKSKRVIHQPM